MELLYLTAWLLILFVSVKTCTNPACPYWRPSQPQAPRPPARCPPEPHTWQSDGALTGKTIRHHSPTAFFPHLLEAVDGALVLDSLAGCHHHAPAHSVNGVGGQAGSDGDTPTQHEGGQEVVLQDRPETLPAHSTAGQQSGEKPPEMSAHQIDTQMG